MDKKVWDDYCGNTEGIAEYCQKLVETNKNSPDPLVRLFFGPQSLSAFADDDKRPALVDIPDPLGDMTEVEIMVEYMGVKEEEAQQVLQLRDMQTMLKKYENLRREFQQ